VCLLLEFLLVGAVAELVCQGAAEAIQMSSVILAPGTDSVLQIRGTGLNVLERVFQMIDLAQPLLVEHVMRTTSKRDTCHYTVLVSMCKTNGI
jgi:hypothetical protein